ncbi:MAG: divergent polysaccharide deacetylase family protein [Pseudomonadota bacterium]
MRRWEFKRPILGRLVWGWLGFGILACGVGAWLFFGPSDRAEVGKIALDVDADLNRLAPPDPLRLSPPAATPSSRQADNENKSRLSGAVQPTFASAAPNQIEVPLDAESGEVDASPPVSPAFDTAADQPPGGSQSSSRARFKSIPVAADAASEAAPGTLSITIDGRDIDAPVDAPVRAFARQRWTRERLRVASPALLQATEFGAIPRIAEDGRQPMDWYARPYEQRGPAFAIILTGLGSDAAVTQAAIETLPGPVTLSFAPYARGLAAMMDRARAFGHETMLDLPLEGYGRDAERTLGPAGLLTSRTASENTKRLDWILSRGQSYIGLTNYQGAKFTGAPGAMAPVLNRLTALGLAYIDDTGLTGGGDKDAPTIVRLIGADAAAMGEKLASLTGDKAPNPRIVIKVPATTGAVAALDKFLAGLTEADRALAPASALVYGPTL